MASPAYVHARHEGRRRVLRWWIDHFALRFLIKVDRVEGLENLPPSGAAILMMNHIAFVDPIVVMGCVPRNIVPMAKIEAYHYPIIGVFPRLWDAIPVRRGESDRAALRKALDVLSAGEVVLVAPEGTRSPALGQGREGVAFLAHRAGAMVIPTMIEGTEGFPSISPRRWSGPGAVVRLGRPFRFRPTAVRLGRERLRLMTDEAMFVLAGNLPEPRRGSYSDMQKATRSTIDFV